MSSRPQSQLARSALGVLGTVGEAAGGTQLGDAVLEALLDRIAARLEALVAERQAAGAAELSPAHLSRPRFTDED